MSNPAARKVSSRDVAEAAGVSRSTVSFVLNGRADMGIAEATQQRVWDAAHALGYTPSPEARALKLGRSAIVLFLLPDWPITGPLGVLLEELSGELAQAGLTMLAHQRAPGDDLSQVLGALTPTAVIAMCQLSEAEVTLAEQRGIDVRAFMTTLPGHQDEANLRQRDIGELQVSCLVDNGHTTLAYVAAQRGKLDWFSTPRLQGAQAEAKRRAVRLSHRHMRADDHAHLRTWLRKLVDQGTTAVAAYNDEVAFAVLMAASDEGLSVPDKLSVIGVDDSALSVLARPALSTIGFRLAQEAKRLAALVTGSDPSTDGRNGGSEVLHVVLRSSVRRLT